MTWGNTVQIVGNLTRPPEMRYTPAGAGVAEFGVAWNRRYERNGETVEEVSYFDVTCWGTLGENVAASLHKGDRVIVVGRLEQQTWQTDGGENRSKIRIVADEVGPSLRWAEATVAKNARTDQPESGGRPSARSNEPDYSEGPF